MTTVYEPLKRASWDSVERKILEANAAAYKAENAEFERVLTIKIKELQEILDESKERPSWLSAKAIAGSVGDII